MEVTRKRVSELRVGETFRQYHAASSPLYTVRKKENGKVFADSKVTSLSEVTIKDEVFSFGMEINNHPAYWNNNNQTDGQ